MSKNNKKNLFLIFFCSVLLLLLIIFIYSPPRDVLYTVQYGEIRQDFSTQAVFIRDEFTVESQYSGQVNILVGEGERIRSGSPVLAIKDGEEEFTVYAFDTGVISFKHDGDETIYSPDNWENLTRDMVTGARNNFSSLRDGNRVRDDQLLFRIVNNFSLYIAIFFPPEQPIPSEGSSLRIEFPRLDREIYWGQIVDIVFRERIVIVELRQFIDEFLSLRTQPINVIKGVFRGSVVPREAIFETEEGYAVLMPGRDQPVQRTVKVLGGNENKAVVDGLTPGDEIFLQPNQ